MRVSFLAVALATVSIPAGAQAPPTLDEWAFDKATSLAAQCSPLFALTEMTEEQEASQWMCASFAHGVVGGMVAASKYEIEGQKVCASPVMPAVVFDRAAQFVRLEPAVSERMTAAELIVVTYLAFSPCPTQ